MFKLIYFALCVILFEGLSPASVIDKTVGKPSALVTSKPVAGGIDYHYYKYAELLGGPQSISVVIVDPKKADIALFGCPGGNREKTSVIAKWLNADIAVNAGYFKMNHGISFKSLHKKSKAVGYLKINGTVWNSSLRGTKNRGFMVISKKGVVKIMRPESLDVKEYPTVLYSPQLLRIDGRDYTMTSKNHNAKCHPRTLFGIRKDGKLVIVVVDGRHKEAKGMNYYAAARLMEKLDCTDAITFDGGGSSTLCLKYQGVVNYPSDNKKFDHYGERMVHNILYVKRKKK